VAPSRPTYEAERNGKPRLAPAVSEVLARALRRRGRQASFDSVGEFVRELCTAMSSGTTSSEGRGIIKLQREKSSGWALMIQLQLRDKHQIKPWRRFTPLRRRDPVPREDRTAPCAECSVFVACSPSTTHAVELGAQGDRRALRGPAPMIPIFQESFKRHAPVPDDPPYTPCCNTTGWNCWTRRNIHIQHTLNDLVAPDPAHAGGMAPPS